MTTENRTPDKDPQPEGATPVSIKSLEDDNAILVLANRTLRDRLKEKDAEIARLRAALQEMIDSTEQWNESVQSIIGRQPATGIDLEKAKQALCTAPASEEVRG